MTRAKSQKMLKDPFRPRRPVSSFAWFFKDNKDAILKQNPHLNLIKNSAMMKIAGQWWKTAVGHEDEKHKAVNKANKELKKYNRVMKLYQPPSQEELRRRKNEMPKRYRVNWNYFVREKFAPLYKRVGTFGAVSHLLGQKWRTLTEIQKEPYNQMYAADRERYDREMESFRAKYSLQF